VHLFSLICQLSQLLYGCCAKIASRTLCLAFTPLLINSTSKIIKSMLIEIKFEINRNIQQVFLRVVGFGGKVLSAIPRTSLNNLHLKSANGIILLHFNAYTTFVCSIFRVRISTIRSLLRYIIGLLQAGHLKRSSNASSKGYRLQPSVWQV